MARNGVFLPTSIDNESLLKRLAKVGLLFVDQSKQHHPAIKKLLPYGKLSHYHRIFIKHFIELGVSSLLDTYLEHYGLATDSASIEELDLGQIPRWVEFLLLCRSHDNIYQLSLVNASLCLSQDDNNPYPPAVNITGMLSEGRILMALGTLMFAPGSFRETLETESDGGWQLFLNSIRSFPALESCFAADPPIRSGDDLFREMFQYLKEIIPMNLGEIDESTGYLELPEFSSSKYAHIAYRDELNISYFLSSGQPVRAHELYMNSQSGLI